MEKETWKPFTDFNFKYEVSNIGNVRIKKTKLLIKHSYREGYQRVWLIYKHNKKQISVHRLVLMVFKNNPENKTQVNHINGIKDDNRVENLEWCTPYENIKHAWNTGLKKGVKQSEKHKKIIKEVNSKKVYDKNTGKIYDSITDASIILGYKKSTLRHYLLGTRKNKTSLTYFNG